VMLLQVVPNVAEQPGEALAGGQPAGQVEARHRGFGRGGNKSWAEVQHTGKPVLWLGVPWPVTHSSPSSSELPCEEYRKRSTNR